MNRTKTHIARKRIDATSWECMTKALACTNDWKPETMVYVYVESLDDCSLDNLQFGEMAEPSTPFEGRIFDGEVDARWRLLQGGKWVAWIIREGRADESPDGWDRDLVYRLDRRYYLRGTLGAGSNRFHEARYPNRSFSYPVQPVPAGGKDRAYIEVAEYWRTEPDWNKHDDDSARQALALPLLCAHRFLGVNAGTDESRHGGGHGKRHG